ncbi:MAG: SurA N-terminal domain-containing protein [Nitrospirae bacterium]|nr:SurA N-terminal domain-containing protein [Nitrospirota bacterium]
MLKIMGTNKLASYIILVAITVVIIATFVFWGIGPKDRPTEAVVAQIEDEKITTDEFWRAYENEYKRIKENSPNAEDIKKPELQDRVLNSLVNRTVLLIAAEKTGITVTEKELQDAIIKMPYFQRNGVFDQNIYMRALKLNRMTSQAFESELRNDLILNKMTRMIGETSELSPEEIKILDSIGAGNQEQLLQIFRSNKSSQAITAYIESVKRQMKVTVNKDLLS